MRNWIVTAILASLPVVSGAAKATCLPTRGTDNCFRAGDPLIQAIEHRYLDVPAWIGRSRDPAGTGTRDCGMFHRRRRLRKRGKGGVASSLS
jgi:hypothetical protein